MASVIALDAFKDLLEVAEDMRPYVPEYFATKWKHDEDLERAREALAKAEACTCGSAGPDYFGNYDQLEDPDCVLHGPAPATSETHQSLEGQ